MGILSRIKRRLPIVGRSPERRPAAAADQGIKPRAGLTQAAPDPSPPPTPSLSAEEMRAVIKEDVNQHPILLYMKGNAAMPQCGFSAAVVDILRQFEVPFETRDVLADQVLRQEIKEYSDWPTLPQLYIGGEFVGGCDIIREMHGNGELQAAIDQLNS